MFTSSISKFLIVLIVVSIAVLTVSMTPFSKPAVNSQSNGLQEQRRGEWSAGVSPEQAYLNQRYGEWTAGETVVYFADRSYDPIEQVRLDLSNGHLAADSSYDQVELLRIDRSGSSMIADHSYDGIEGLRAQRFFK